MPSKGPKCGLPKGAEPVNSILTLFHMFLHQSGNDFFFLQCLIKVIKDRWVLLSWNAQDPMQTDSFCIWKGASSANQQKTQNSRTDRWNFFIQLDPPSSAFPMVSACYPHWEPIKCKKKKRTQCCCAQGQSASLLITRRMGYPTGFRCDKA